jgi:hypothetical protein
MDTVVSPTLVQHLRAVWEAVNNRWNQWVLNYTQGASSTCSRPWASPRPAGRTWCACWACLLARRPWAVPLGAWERLQHDPWLRLLALARKRLARGAHAPSARRHAPWPMPRAHSGAADAAGPLAAGLERLRYAAPDDNPAPRLLQLRRRFAALALPTPSA